VHARNHIYRARSQRHLTIAEWRKRVFTDEIHIELSPRDMVVKMFNVRSVLTLLGQLSTPKYRI